MSERSAASGNSSTKMSTAVSALSAETRSGDAHMTITTQFTPVPEINAVTEGRLHPGPRRHLDGRLADSILAAKEAMGLTWRELAVKTGISRAHLNHLSLGRRVPSYRTTEILVAELDLDEVIAEELRAASVSTWPHNIKDER
jgi:hypothetical protein